MQNGQPMIATLEAVFNLGDLFDEATRVLT
jgi:hypothetical protein